MSSVFNTRIEIPSSEGSIVPTQMMNWNRDTSEQSANIGQMGSNLIKPFFEASSPDNDTITYTLDNGATITFNKVYQAGPPTYHYIDYVYTGLNGSRTGSYGPIENGLDGIYLTWDPYTDNINDIENGGILKHYNNLSTNPGYYFDTNMPSAADTALIKSLFKNLDLEEEEEDITLPQGGIPMMDVHSDDIPFPSLPVLNILDTEMIYVYQMTTAEVRSFIQYLWSSDFSNDLEKNYNDPMEAVYNLGILPLTASTTYPSAIQIGNAVAKDDNHIVLMSSRVNTQYYYIDFGKLSIGTYLSTYYDWNPYTRAEIYLPFIGVAQLDIDEVMGSELWLQYMVDVVSGSFTAMLHIRRVNGNNPNEELKGILYHWNGNCMTKCPMSSKDYSQQISNSINTVSSVMAGAMSGALTGAMIGSAAGGIGAVPGAAAGAIVGGGTALVSGKVKEMTTPTPIKHSGNISANHGYMGIQSAYIILSRPTVTAPKSIKHDKGLFINMTAKIGNLKGYTKMSSIHVDNIPGATDKELAEIEKILKEGFIA